ncbi:hypothetical protein OAS89_04290 [Alphaproteobacteria bacterium]|nr:hypothetical protein [Alphaproteobacteria bacterium]
MLQIIAFAMTSPLQTPKQKHKNDSPKGVNKPLKPPASISIGTSIIKIKPQQPQITKAPNIWPSIFESSQITVMAQSATISQSCKTAFTGATKMG